MEISLKLVPRCYLKAEDTGKQHDLKDNAMAPAAAYYPPIRKKAKKHDDLFAPPALVTR